MGQPTSQRDPKTRFSDRVQFYVSSRPKYPPAFLEFCRSKLGLRQPHRVADIGSGTGILSELFVRNGNVVMAIEPNGPMRAAAETALGDAPNYHSIDAAAEATDLDPASVDFVVAGQAFHWFDRVRCREEFKRILRPGGWVVLVWNERRSDDHGFAEHYGQIVREFQTGMKDVAHQRMTATDSEELKKFFEPAGYAVETFAHSQFLDLDGVVARALSSSYLPLPGQPRCEEMIGRLREEFSKYAVGGKVLQDYDTKAFYGRVV